MPTDYAKLLNPQSQPVSTYGLTPGQIAAFSSQELGQSNQRNQVLRAILSKKQDTMLDLEVGGKMYKVPAQHYGSIMNAITSKQDKQTTKTSQEAKDKYYQESMITYKGKKYTPQDYQRIKDTEKTKNKSSVGDLTQFQEFQKERYNRQDKREANELRQQEHLAIASGELKGKSIPYEARKERAKLANLDIDNPYLYLSDEPWLGGNKIDSWKIPENITVGGQPLTKAMLLQGYQNNLQQEPNKTFEDYIKIFRQNLEKGFK